MIRRIAMAAGIFAALFLAVFVYDFVAGEDNLPVLGRGREGRRSASRDAAGGLGGTGKFRIERRDQSGRLIGLYLAEQSRKLSENSFAMKRPVITLYRSSGQRIYIRADSGMLYSAEAGTNFEPTRGLLEGRVRVFVDRSTDPSRPAALTAEKDLIRIYGREVEFDSDNLTIHMRGDVSVLSAEADIFGRDLSVQWHEAPRTDLKLFKIAHGYSMIVYEAKNILDTASAESPTTRPARPASPARPVAPARPAAPVPRASPGPPRLPRRAVGGSSPPELPKPHNIYLATFRDNVQVFSGLRSMRYANELTIKFEWDRDVQGLPARGPAPPGKAAPATSAKPGPVAPSLIAMTASGASLAEPADVPPGMSASRPATRPTTQPARRPKDRQPTVILWSGPLIIEPVGRTAKPDSKRYFIEARGRRIVWETEDVAAVCRTFSLRQTSDGKTTDQTIHLTGVREAPIRLVRSRARGGERIRCREITYLPDRGWARLTGPGRIIDPPPEQDVDDPRLALDIDDLPDLPGLPGSDRLTWTDALVATLEQIRTTDSTGKRSTRTLITSAVLTGQVELDQASSGNFVRCDEKLQVWMARSKKDPARIQTYPSRAKAVGNVEARQEGRDISADEMTIEFAERDAETAAADKSAAAGKKPPGGPLGKNLSVRAVRLDAVGNVRINDTRGAEPLVASADRLESNLVDEKALLEGTPARVAQGQTVLRGRRIHLDQAGPSLVVVGAGDLKFNTDRDLDGKMLPKPRPMTVAWTRRMSFAGKKNKASFVGGVTAVGGDDRIAAREMDVLFDPVAAPPDAKKPPKAPADKAAKGRMSGLGMDKRRIKTIICRGAVSMNRIMTDATGRLVERTRLTGEQLTYDAGAAKDAKTAKMTVDGPGTMSMEDYKPPKAKAGKKPLAMPSQTLFVWKGGMAFAQKDRQVVLHGGVTMRHRSGSEIVLAEGLSVAALGRLAAGRNVKLSCRKMVVLFGDTDTPVGTDARPDAGTDTMGGAMSLGRLKLFRAIGGVELVEGRRRMLGEVLNYDRIREIVVIEGTRDTPATLMYHPSPQAMIKTIRSTRIECFLKDNKIVRIETAGIIGGG